MTCRDEIISAVKQITKRKRLNEFTIPEVVSQMEYNGTLYSKNTIRTEITCRLCINAPKNHAVTHADYERTYRGIYKPLF